MIARKHHYVPQCYLKGFVKHREKPQLYVVDAKAPTPFCTTPANVAAERDFHRIEVDGWPPDALEQAFSQFESELAPALERIIAARSIKDQNDRAFLFNLIGVMAVKNPRHRETFRKFQETVAKRIMDLVIETPERWRSQVARAQRDGYVSKDSAVTYEQMKAFVESGEYTINVPTGMHLELELGSLDAVLPYLFDRKWMLFRAPPKSTGFITSDHPVCLMWSDPKRRGQFKGPGFGRRGTEVLFPVSNDLAIVGAFEADECEVDATPGLIAQINGAFVAYAERQVYARDRDFLYWMGPHQKVRQGSTLRNDPCFARPRSSRARGRTAIID